MCAVIFIVFLVLALFTGDRLSVLVWLAFLVGTGLSYATGALPPTRPLARRLASIGATICLIIAVLLAVYVGFFRKS
jgi:hypothetical protein